jgi:NADH-quinone oxidoreductase subunit N
MALGAFAAIGQTNIKRLMAYSSISHMGYALVGLAAAGQDGVRAVVVYMLIYMVTTTGVFACILAMRRQGKQVEEISDLAGLASSNKTLAFVLAMLMFSLAGIPPTVGFAAKLGVLEALVDGEHTFLAIIAVIASLIGAFYYLRVVKVMYFDEPKEEHAAEISGSGFARGLLSLNAILVLALGILPAGLMAVCLDAMRRTLLGS